MPDINKMLQMNNAFYAFISRLKQPRKESTNLKIG